MTTTPEFRDYMTVLTEMKMAVNRELDKAQVGSTGSGILDAWQEVLAARAAICAQRFADVEGQPGG